MPTFAAVLTYTTWAATGLVGLIFLRYRTRHPVYLPVAASLCMGFILSTAQMLLRDFGIDNTALQYAWPLVTVPVLLFGVARTPTDAAVGTAILLLVGALASQLIIDPAHPDLYLAARTLTLPLAGSVLAFILWHGCYHRTRLEVALWIFYLVPVPGLLWARWAPQIFLPAWGFQRLCQLTAVCLLLSWLIRGFSSSSRDSSSSLSLVSPSSRRSASKGIGTGPTNSRNSGTTRSPTLRKPWPRSVG